MALADSIVASWRMNEVLDVEDLVDVVNSNTLTGTNDPVVTQGLIQNGRKFTGHNGNNTGQYFSAADSATLSCASTDFTIIGWFVWTGATPGEGGGNVSLTKSNLSDADDLEYQVRVHTTGTGLLDVYFNVADASGDAIGIGNYLRFIVCKDGSYYRNWQDTWHMFMATYDTSAQKVEMHVWQGNKLTGLPPTLSQDIWNEDEYGRHSSPGGLSGDTASFGGVKDGTGTLNLGVIKTNRASPDDLFYATNFTVDNISIWKRKLTLDEGKELWNQGTGLEYPFLQSTGQKWEQAQDPIFLPTPHSLYQGATWDVGDTPPVPPAPDAGWMTQPTLPAWRIPERIQGWSYGNNFPQAAAVPLVSQWWIQSSEPVQDKVKKDTEAVSMMSPASDQEIVVPPAVPDPPTPGDPPLDDSEAIVSDEVYRPGRADGSSDRYRK